ncbi:MAG: ribose 5-phosphate isomerase B [Chitinivibrionales bacterium]|nr:ribose 5-phosphate isomerase B [Chitinivibrionales bacterium]
MTEQGKPSVWVGNDHGGYELKQRLIPLLREWGHEVVNVGSDTSDIVRYPYYAAKVAGAVSRGEADRGVLICSTGIGMSMVANMYRGVRAALCTSTYTARMTRAHNDSNVLCLGGKTAGEFEIIDMLSTWLTTGYEGGRHDISLGLIADAESALLTGSEWAPPPGR